MNKEEPKKKKRTPSAVVAGIAFMILFWGYQGYLVIENLEIKRKVYVNKYVESQERLERLKYKLNSVRANSFKNESMEIAGRLLAEKLLIIDKEAGKNVWISSIRLVTEKGENSSENQELKIVDIDGFVLGGRRVADQFIQRLRHNETFMASLKYITLDDFRENIDKTGNRSEFRITFQQEVRNWGEIRRKREIEKEVDGLTDTALEKMQEKIKMLEEIDGLAAGKSIE